MLLIKIEVNLANEVILNKKTVEQFLKEGFQVGFSKILETLMNGQRYDSIFGYKNMKNKTTIYIVRHADVLYTGQPSDKFVHLTQDGWEKAVKLSQNWQGDIHRIYSSPLQRCVETITPLSLDKNLRYEIVDNLKELEYMGNAQEFHEKTLINTNFHFDNGETLVKANSRFEGILLSIAKENLDRSIVISTHGTVFSQFLINKFGLNKDIFFELTYPDLFKFEFNLVNEKFYNLERINLS